MSSETPYIVTGTADRGARARRTPPSRRIPLLYVALALVAVFLAGDAVLWFSAWGQADRAVEATVREAMARRQDEAEAAASAKGKKGKKKPETTDSGGETTLAALTTENGTLEKDLAGYQPNGIYIVIDTANNRLKMKKGDETLLDASCSTGSYSRLDAPDGRSWFFHTPRGKFRILGKKQNPVWVKPDWAFVEEDEPIPGATHPDRYEPYVMGDYALSFGNGYYIHGTLYRRLLGQSVTHGCVRLGDDELEQVYRTAPVGTPIFIY